MASLEQQRRRATVLNWKGRYGNYCPGYGRIPHTATDLTADHWLPISEGGISGELTVLCRSCNSRRSNNPPAKHQPRLPL